MATGVARPRAQGQLITNTEIPEPIKALENAEVRFKEICEKDTMLSAVYKTLGI